jgi:hypothetical protein
MAKAVEALAAHLRDDDVPEPRLWDYGDFSEIDIEAINLIARKQAQDAFDEGAFVKAMDATAPVLARPQMTEKPLDLWRTLSQPEILESLWPNWNARTGKRGRDPGYFAKALLVITAARGVSAHFDDNHHDLAGYSTKPTLLQMVFDWIESTAAIATGRIPQPFARKEYAKAMEQIGLIVDQSRNPGALTTDDCISTNLELLKWLSVTYPKTGRLLGIDAMLIEAWVKQPGKQRSTREEKRLRRRAPNATLRTFTNPDGSLKRSLYGYNLVVITDLATSLPVVWGLWPAGKGYNDARALRFLLNDLFEKWPECPTTHIVADRAWDNVEAIEDCAVRFGIHLIVDRDKPSWNREPTKLTEFESKKIRSFDGRGIAYCRTHGVAMRRAGHQFVGREQRAKRGMKPGERANPREFRLRFECPVEGCDGKPHLHMDRDWAALSAYPHTIDGGREDLHAFRLAMYSRRNSCEALFASLKIGHKLGLDGASRTHTSNESTVETLLSIGLLLRTAFVVAHERIQQDPSQGDPPPDLAAELEAAA